MMTEKMRNTQELLNDLVKDTPTLAKKMHDSRKSNRLICDLIRLRAASGLTQTAMAEKMGCGQSRISKLEHGTDEDITLGELDAYLRALDKHLYMAVFSSELNASSMIKYHTCAIRKELENLIRLAEADQKIAKGIDSFSMDLFYVFCKMLDELSAKLPDSSFQKLLSEQKRRPSVLISECEPEMEPV